MTGTGAASGGGGGSIAFTRAFGSATSSGAITINTAVGSSAGKSVSTVVRL